MKLSPMTPCLLIALLHPVMHAARLKEQRSAVQCVRLLWASLLFSTHVVLADTLALLSLLKICIIRYHTLGVVKAAYTVP